MAFGDVIRSALNPGSSFFIGGIGGDASSIWYCDLVAELVYELSVTDFSVVRSAGSPSNIPSGIGGTASVIWYSDNGSNRVYELSVTDLSVVRFAASPSLSPRGIGGDASVIWHAEDSGGAGLYELSIVDFSVVNTGSFPGTKASSVPGMGGDTSVIWHCNKVDDKLYELSVSDLSVVRTTAGRGKPGAIGGKVDIIWHADIDATRVYELEPVTLATLTTQATTDITAITATGHGTITDIGGAAVTEHGDCWSESPNPTIADSKTENGAAIAGAFTSNITGLNPNTLYHRRPYAINSYGTDYGSDETFTTLAAIPTVTTDPASAVSAIAATLNGTLDDDGGLACDCGFEWGETIAYGNTTPTQSRTTGQTFAQTISGLDPAKTYHFRTFATNAGGTSYGVDRTFTTLIAVPTVTTDPASALSAIAATLNGTLDDDGGEACDCGFEWGLDIGYGTITPTESKTTGETFSQVIGGLFPGTTYHFRAFATNSVGTSYGADRSFASAQVISRSYALARREL